MDDGASALAGSRTLDALLEPVADWLEGQDAIGTGAVRDRLDDIIARRRVRGVSEDWRFNAGSDWQCGNPAKYTASIELVRWMRGCGFTFREIARELGCSTGWAHRLAHMPKR